MNGYLIRYETARVPLEKLSNGLLVEQREKLSHLFVGDNELGLFRGRFASTTITSITTIHA